MVGMSSPRRPGQWRWVAHPPWRPPSPLHRPPAPRHQQGPAWGDRTPTYSQTPRWGLPLVAIPRHLDPQVARRRARLASSAPGILRVAQSWLLVAAGVHLLRYVMLAWYSDRVAPWWVEVFTTSLVWVAESVALVVGLAAALTAIAWLVEKRRAAYVPGSDPRRRVELWLCCLIPVVNWLRPPVYLEELRRATEATTSRAPSRYTLRRWWAIWVLNGLAVAVALWRGAAEGPQAAADTVLLTALATLVAAWVVHSTRGVIGSFSDPSPQLTRRLLVREIVNTSAAREE